MEKEQFLEVYRHSLAHILAKAVIEIYGKEVQYAIGPQIADGCYYDFVLPEAITESDFKTIESKANKLGGDCYVVVNEKKIYNKDGKSVNLF